VALGQACFAFLESGKTKFATEIAGLPEVEIKRKFYFIHKSKCRELKKRERTVARG
jgi:hypothetical protein